MGLNKKFCEMVSGLYMKGGGYTPKKCYPRFMHKRLSLGSQGQKQKTLKNFHFAFAAKKGVYAQKVLYRVGGYTRGIAVNTVQS